jgi:hypothetical protein
MCTKDGPKELDPETKVALRHCKLDNTAIVNISVQFYLTEDFHNMFMSKKDAHNYIQFKIIEKANWIYNLNDVPISVFAHGIEHLNISETGCTGSQRLDVFSRGIDIQQDLQDCFGYGYRYNSPPMKSLVSKSSITCQAACAAVDGCVVFAFDTRNNRCDLQAITSAYVECTTCVTGQPSCPAPTSSVEKILKSADVAFLITAKGTSDGDWKVMGTANLGPWKTTYGPPLAWVAPIGSELTFVHELGHIMGAHHNRENTGWTYMNIYGYGYGYQIPETPFYTIMSYSDLNRGYTKSVPYFSANHVTIDGFSIGDENNNNHRLMIETRCDIAFHGDESQKTNLTLDKEEK